MLPECQEITGKWNKGGDDCQLRELLGLGIGIVSPIISNYRPIIAPNYRLPRLSPRLSSPDYPISRSPDLNVPFPRLPSLKLY